MKSSFNRKSGVGLRGRMGHVDAWNCSDHFCRCTRMLASRNPRPASPTPKFFRRSIRALGLARAVDLALADQILSQLEGEANRRLGLEHCRNTISARSRCLSPRLEACQADGEGASFGDRARCPSGNNAALLLCLPFRSWHGPRREELPDRRAQPQRDLDIIS